MNSLYLLELIVCRFGSIPYQSDPVLRKLKVKNISSIKVSVVWRMFFLNTSSDNENPLNLSEIASDATLEPNDAYVENKWCGKEIDDDVFKVGSQIFSIIINSIRYVFFSVVKMFMINTSTYLWLGLKNIKQKNV